MAELLAMKARNKPMNQTKTSLDNILTCVHVICSAEQLRAENKVTHNSGSQEDYLSGEDPRC